MSKFSHTINGRSAHLEGRFTHLNQTAFHNNQNGLFYWPHNIYIYNEHYLI